MADVAQLLGVSRPRVWQLRKRSDFPDPAGSEGGRDYWYEASILRWAANAGRALAGRAPILFRPAPASPSSYIGAEIVNNHALFAWDTAYGVVCLGYRPAYWDRPTPRQLLGLAHQADAVVSVRPHWNSRGPELEAADRDASSRPYEPRWTDLQRILGMAGPWWPSALRRLEEMVRWVPGAEPRNATAVPDVDIGPLLRLATDAPDGSPVNVVLLHLARSIQARATESAENSIEDLADIQDRDAIALAAVPATTRPEEDEPEENVRRQAWLEVLNRSDDLAEQCIEAAMQWNGGRDFPFSGFREIEPTGKIAAEWSSTLRPAKRTAAFAVFDERDVAQGLIDPATDLPVARDQEGIYRATTPHRLPAGTDLDQLLLEGENVWVRTVDGTLYLAPEQPGSGVAYGYTGSGPITLAGLIDRLLDDINAPPPRPWGNSEPPPGLLAGSTGKWQDGDVITRGELLAARGAE
jgi:predicted DNA-binding transcriptional regulator AlpA